MQNLVLRQRHQKILSLDGRRIEGDALARNPLGHPGHVVGHGVPVVRRSCQRNQQRDSKDHGNDCCHQAVEAGQPRPAAQRVCCTASQPPGPLNRERPNQHKGETGPDKSQDAPGNRIQRRGCLGSNSNEESDQQERRGQCSARVVSSSNKQEYNQQDQ